MSSSRMNACFAIVALCLLAFTIPSCSPSGEATPLSGGDDNGGDPGGGSQAATVIRGRLAVSPARPAPPAARVADAADLADCVVVAVSDQTGAVYRGAVSEDGTFQINVPESEEGNTLIQTIVGPDGKPLGPIVMSDDGATGLKPEGETDLGTILLPGDPAAEPITVGTDSAIGGSDVDPATRARLDENGVPVGVKSFGKGPDSLLSEGDVADGADRDKDGLVDLFDADDDGNGVVNDFEPGRGTWTVPATADVRPNFFMNLKIPVEDAAVFYTGTDEQKDTALATKTVITFEVVPEPSATRTIASVRMLDTPAPAYLSTATVLASGPGPAPLWSATGYAFTLEGDGRYDAFVTPQAVMDCGDSFTVEVTYTDGTSEQFTRMIAYVFKSIPEIKQFGSPGALENYDPAGTSNKGTPSDPILFDGTQDLVLVWKPPTDETGAPLTKLDYRFEVFFQNSSGQLNGNIDYATTWIAPISNFDRGTYAVSASDLVLNGDGTYTVAIPKDIFVDSVTLVNGETAPVTSYKIDIAAQCPSGNAAIMAEFRKKQEP